MIATRLLGSAGCDRGQRLAYSQQTKRHGPDKLGDSDRARHDVDNEAIWLTEVCTQYREVCCEAIDEVMK